MGWRDHVRGVLIAIALLAHGIYALPFPGAVSEEEVRKDWRQRGLRQWRKRLSMVGVEVEHEALEDGFVKTTTTLHEIQDTLKTPFKPFFQLTNTNQAWALFAAATTRPERLVVEMRRRGEQAWIPLERKLDPCCSWREDQFRFRRLRGVWDGQKDHIRPGYRNLSKWAARQVFDEFEDAVEMRIYIERGYTRYPWGTPKDDVVIRHELRFRRNQPGRWRIRGPAPEPNPDD